MCKASVTYLLFVVTDKCRGRFSNCQVKLKVLVKNLKKEKSELEASVESLEAELQHYKDKDTGSLAEFESVAKTAVH